MTLQLCHIDTIPDADNGDREHKERSSSDGSGDDQPGSNNLSPGEHRNITAVDTYSEGDYPGHLPSYHSDSENEEIERFKEEIECEVANYLLEQEEKTRCPKPVSIKQEPRELPRTSPKPHLPPPNPFQPLLARRKPRKPLRRPKPETIEKLCRSTTPTSCENHEHTSADQNIAPHERSIANGFWLSQNQTETNNSQTLDPSWGNHDLTAPKNSWESIYDQYYVHPSPLHDPKIYRVPRPRNSIEMSTEDSSVFSDPHLVRHGPNTQYRQHTSSVQTGEPIYATSQPLYRPLSSSECSDRWLHPRYNASAPRQPVIEHPPQTPTCYQRYPLIDSTNTYTRIPRRKRRQEFRDTKPVRIISLKNDS